MVERAPCSSLVESRSPAQNIPLSGKPERTRNPFGLCAIGAHPTKYCSMNKTAHRTTHKGGCSLTRRWRVRTRPRSAVGGFAGCRGGALATYAEPTGQRPRLVVVSASERDPPARKWPGVARHRRVSPWHPTSCGWKTTYKTAPKVRSGVRRWTPCGTPARTARPPWRGESRMLRGDSHFFHLRLALPYDGQAVQRLNLLVLPGTPTWRRTHRTQQQSNARGA
jgi:hypothetical protein